MSTVCDFIIFSANNRLYALSVEQIEKIDTFESLTPSVNAPFFVEGLVSFQNHVIRVADFYKLASGVNKSNEVDILSKKLIIYKGKGELFALVVDSILNMIQIENKMIKQYPKEVSVSDLVKAEGILEYNKQLIIVIKSIQLDIND